MPSPTPIATVSHRRQRVARHGLVLFAAVGLGGCATISKGCPTDPRDEAPWWCAVANVQEDVYEDETARRAGDIGEERGRLEETEGAVATDRERLRGAEVENAALTAELDRLRGEVRSAQVELEALRSGNTRSENELGRLASRLDDVTAEIDALGTSSAGAGEADVAVSRTRRAELEAELDSILEALTE